MILIIFINTYDTIRVYRCQDGVREFLEKSFKLIVAKFAKELIDANV